MFPKIFQVTDDEGMGKLSKCVEFSTQKPFQICACVISVRKQNILTPQPCLRTRELKQQRFERRTSTGSGRFASLGGGLVEILR